jgi:DNA-binding HxlR family transcriptional regulator
MVDRGKQELSGRWEKLVVKELLEKGHMRANNIKSNLKGRNEIVCDG